MYYNVYIRYVECSGVLVELAEQDEEYLPLGVTLLYIYVYIRYVECSGGLVELAEEDGQHLPLGGPHLQYRGKAAKRGKSLPPRQPRGLNHQGEWLELFFFFFGGVGKENVRHETEPKSYNAMGVLYSRMFLDPDLASM